MRILLFILLCLSLNAKTMTARYYAKYGWFGTVAEAKGIYENNKTSYKIKAYTVTRGIAASLSKHLKQYYESEGKIVNGLLLPEKYTFTVIRGGKTYLRKFVFDRKNKKITKYYYTDGKYEKNKTLPFYTDNDILSLYFNLKTYLKNADKTKLYTFYAVGGRKNDGRIDVTFPDGEELETIKNTFDSPNGLYIKANLYNKVFTGDKGILYLVIDPENWVTVEGMVKNVLKIGDLKGKLKDFKLIP